MLPIRQISFHLNFVRFKKFEYHAECIDKENKKQKTKKHEKKS